MIEHRSTDSSMMSDVPENCSVNQPKESPQRRSWRQHTNLLCAANVGNGLLEDERESGQGRQSPPNRSEMAKEHRFRKHAVFSLCVATALKPRARSGGSVSPPQEGKDLACRLRQ